MFKRNLLMVLIVGLALVLATNAFGQNTKAKRIIKKGKATTTSKNARKTKTVRGFTSTTQPFPDGVVKRKRLNNQGTSTRQRPTKPIRNLEAENGGLETTPEEPPFGDGNRKAPNKKPIVIEDHVDMVTSSPRQTTARKRRTASRKKPRKTPNLLPYVEQDNIYRKRKRN